MDLANRSIITRQYVEWWIHMTIEKRLNHRDDRIPSRIDYPTTVTEILITLTDQVEEPLAW